MLSTHWLAPSLLIVAFGAGVAFADGDASSDGEGERSNGCAERDGDREHRPEHRFVLTSDSELRLSGRATIGSWNSASDRVEGRLEPGVGLAQVHALIERVTEAIAQHDARDGTRPDVELELAAHDEPCVTLAVAVASLRSGKPGMERDMRDALRADAHPQVTYNLQRVGDARWRYDERRNRLAFMLTAEGELSLAGVERVIEMDVRIEPINPNRFRVIGRRAFDMADFDIEPPTALFGLIKADPRVEVVFDLIVEAVPRPADDASDRGN